MITQVIQTLFVVLNALIHLFSLHVIFHEQLKWSNGIRMFLRDGFESHFSAAFRKLIFLSSKMHLSKLCPKICLRKWPNCFTSFRTCERMQFGQNSKFTYTLLEFSCFSLIFIALADLLNLSSIKIVASSRAMNIKDMSDIEDRLQILEEGIVNNFEAYSEVKAESMENTSSWHLWRIRSYLVIIVTSNLRVNIVFIELFTLFAFDEEQIKKIYKAFTKLRK